MRRFFRQRHADQQDVDVLAQEVVQRFLVQPAVPRRGDAPVRVPRAGDDEAFIVFGFRGGARGGRVGDHVHAHGFGYAADLAADAAVAEDAEALAGFIAEGVEDGGVGGFAPVVGDLPGVQEGVVVGVGEGGEDDPFGDLGAVDAGGGGEGDVGVGVDGGLVHVVCPCRDEVDEAQVGAVRRGWGQGGQGYEDGDIVEDLWTTLDPG